MSRYNRKCDLCNGEMEEVFWDGCVDFNCCECGNSIRLFYISDDDNTLLEEY